MKHFEHILICDTCKGEGSKDFAICKTCKGSGRVLKTTVTNTEPYMAGKPVTNRMFERLHKVTVSIHGGDLIGVINGEKVEKR